MFTVSPRELEQQAFLSQAPATNYPAAYNEAHLTRHNVTQNNDRIDFREPSTPPSDGIPNDLLDTFLNSDVFEEEQPAALQAQPMGHFPHGAIYSAPLSMPQEPFLDSAHTELEPLHAPLPMPMEDHTASYPPQQFQFGYPEYTQHPSNSSNLPHVYSDDVQMFGGAQQTYVPMDIPDELTRHHMGIIPPDPTMQAYFFGNQFGNRTLEPIPQAAPERVVPHAYSESGFAEVLDICKYIPDKPVPENMIPVALRPSGLPESRINEVNNLMLLVRKHASALRKMKVSNKHLESCITDGVHYLNGLKPQEQPIPTHLVQQYFADWLDAVKTIKPDEHFRPIINLQTRMNEMRANRKTTLEIRAKKKGVEVKLASMTPPEHLTEAKDVMNQIVIKTDSIVRAKKIKKDNEKATNEVLPSVLTEHASQMPTPIPLQEMQQYYLEAVRATTRNIHKSPSMQA